MTKTIRVLALTLALMLLAATPAMAFGADRLKGELDGATVGFDPDPVAVAERCPDGFQWILMSAGVVHVDTLVYSGEMAMTSEHCSRWVTPPAARARGAVGAGIMVLTTPGGDELTLAYEGAFTFRGDTEVAWISKIKGTWEVVDGSGLFTGAGGAGSLHFRDETRKSLAEYSFLRGER